MRNKLECPQEKYVESLLSRYPELYIIRKEIIAAYRVMQKTYIHKGKLLIAGNGGSAADAEHIAGELMKEFCIQRILGNEFKNKLVSVDEERGIILSQQLEGALPAIPLPMCRAVSTAYINDVGAEGVYAQQLLGLGKSEDTFLVISTSGNSENIINAAVVAKAMGMQIIALTGNSGGEIKQFADVVVAVPKKETYMIQELHLPIYHCWCLMLEDFFFANQCQ